MHSRQNEDPKKDNKKILNQQTNPAKLTPREKEVMILLCQELTSKQIAYDLGISPSTVDTHRKSLIFKTGSFCVIGVVNYAHRHKYVAQTLLFLLHNFMVDYVTLLDV